MLFVEMTRRSLEDDAIVSSIRIQTEQLRSQFSPAHGMSLQQLLAPAFVEELLRIVHGLAADTRHLIAPEYSFAHDGAELAWLRVTAQPTTGGWRYLVTFLRVHGTLERLFSMPGTLASGGHTARRDMLIDTCEAARSALDLGSYQAETLRRVLGQDQFDGLDQAVNTLRKRLTVLIRDIDEDDAVVSAKDRPAASGQVAFRD